MEFEDFVMKIKDYETVKDKLTVKLAPQGTYPDDVVHRDKLDVVEYVICPISDNAILTVPEKIVTDIWGKTIEEIWAQVDTNIDKSYTISSLTETLIDLTTVGNLELSEEDLDNLNNIDCLVKVVTNKKKMFGASGMFNPQILRILADIHDEFYIIPSSVHEVLIFPADSGMSVDELKMMVESVNKTVVSKSDFLSNNIYIYHKGDEMPQIV